MTPRIGVAASVAWLALGFLYLHMLASTGHLSLPQSVALAIPLLLLLMTCCRIPKYVSRTLPFGTRRQWTAVGGDILIGMIVSASISAVMHACSLPLSRYWPAMTARVDGMLPMITGVSFLTYMLATAVHYVELAVDACRRAELLSREAQLKALKAQINPHFLFNSLNSISALTAAQPAKAREMCIRLSDFLRSSLRLGERTSIPLGEELALTQTYLSVEQIRFGDRLKVNQTLDDGCDDCQVPPLIVQPLIENAIKHGIATLVDGGEIRIATETQDHTLLLTVENPFDPDAPAAGKSGFGLANVRERLRARFGTAGDLAIHMGDSHYRVTLTIPKGRDMGDLQ